MLPQKTPNTPDDQNSGQGLLAAIAKLLKLPEGSAESDVLEYLAEKLTAAPDPAKFVPIDAVQDMMRDRAAKMATKLASYWPACPKPMCSAKSNMPAKKVTSRTGCATGPPPPNLFSGTADPASFDSFLSGVGPTFA